jgi:hypothetical protein
LDNLIVPGFQAMGQENTFARQFWDKTAYILSTKQAQLSEYPTNW